MKKLLALILTLIFLTPALAEGVTPDTLYDQFCDLFAEEYGVAPDGELTQKASDYLDQMTGLIMEPLGLDRRDDLYADWEAVISRLDPSVLRRGDGGEAVAAMQNALLTWNPDCLPRYGADGDFGAEAESALRSFQKEMSLPATGVYDAATRAYLTGWDLHDPLYALILYTAQYADEHLMNGEYAADIEASLEAYLEPDNSEPILLNCAVEMAHIAATLLSQAQIQ